MSNTLNKIHYAVKIDTGTGITSESIGLFEGVIRFTTDTYDMTGAVYEDSTPVELPSKWFTDFLDVNGIGQLGSSIDITAGGDYAYLQNSSIRVVNYTPLGNRYHDTLHNTSAQYVVGSTMTIYVILDDVVYTRWTGAISGTQISDEFFTFIGKDSKNNKNDTIEGVAYGSVAGVPATMKYDSEVKFRDRLVTSFGGSTERNEYIPAAYGPTENTTGVKPGFSTYNGVAGLWGRDFTGDAGNGAAYLVTYGALKSITLRDGYEVIANSMEVGDLISFSNESEKWIVREIYPSGDVNTSKSTIRIVVDGLTTDLETYANQWGGWGSWQYPNPAPEDQAIIDTIKDLNEDKVYVTIWSKNFLDIDYNNIPNANYITIITEDGEKINVEYTVEDGEVVLSQQISSSINPAVSVKYFTSDSPIFETMDFLDNESTWYKNIGKKDISLSNTLDNDDKFFESDTDKYHYFEVTFDKDVILDEFELSFMLKSVHDNTIENWERTSQQDTWDTLRSNNLWSDGSACTDLMDQWNSAAEYSGTHTSMFGLKLFRLEYDEVYGGLPVVLGDVNVPNIIKPKDHKSYAGFRTRTSFTAESLTITDIPYFDDDVFTSSRNITLYNEPIDAKPLLPNGTLNTPLGSIANTATTVLFRISGYDDLTTKYNIVNGAGNFSSYSSTIGEDHPEFKFKLNGFALTKVDKSALGGKLSYEAYDENTSTYDKLLKNISKDNGSYDLLNRSDWLTGHYQKEQIDRYTLITQMCKQGFVGGFTNRFGVDAYKTWLSNSDTPLVHDESIILDDSMSALTPTNSSLIYNEFDIKWNYNPVTNVFDSNVAIQRVSEDSFPPSFEDWSSFVSGITDYETASQLWNKSHQAYLVSKVIQKAPSERTDLKFAIDNTLSEDGFQSPIGDNLVDTLLETTNLGYFLGVGETAYLYWDAPLLSGDIVSLISSTGETATVTIGDISVGLAGDPRRWRVTIIEYAAGPSINEFTFDSKYSTFSVFPSAWISNGEYSAEVYLFDEPIVSQTPIVLGSVVEFSYYDKTAAVGAIVDFQCSYEDVLFRNINIKVQITESDYTPTAGVVQGACVGTVIEIGEWNDQPFSTLEFNPRLATFVSKASNTEVGSYPSDYINLMVDYSTYQKYQVRYNLPITEETLQYELLDEVNFSDAIYTPEVGSYGVGFITDFSLNSVDSVFECELTFLPEFLIKSQEPVCVHINEAAGNIDTITESSLNTDYINEMRCNY